MERQSMTGGPIEFGPPALERRRIVWLLVALLGFVVAVVIVAAAVSQLVSPASAAEAVLTAPVVVEPRPWWQSLLESATPVLVAFGIGVLGWIGTIVRKKADQYLPSFVSRIVSDQYEKMADAGAGFLENELKKLSGAAQTPFQAAVAPIAGTPAPALTPDHPAVKAAVDYVHESFPETLGKAGVYGSKGEVAADIIGAFGKLILAGKAKPAGG